MARNQEKSQAMLNKFLAAKAGFEKKPEERRPYLASMVDNLQEAQKWRNTLVRDISAKVMEIQNSSLGEHKIRDLNDEINKLLRTKAHWERRILELGGPNYEKLGSRAKNSVDEGVTAAFVGRGGYKYFGAAKDLPGVQELFQTRNVESKSRKEMFKGVDGDYFGFRQLDEEEILEQEAVLEKRARDREIDRWELLNGKFQLRDAEGNVVQDIQEFEPSLAGMDLPSSEDIDRLVVERRKAELLEKLRYSEALAAED